MYVPTYNNITSNNGTYVWCKCFNVMFVFEVIFHFITMAIFVRGMIIDTELAGEFLLNFSKSKIGVYFFKIGPKQWY